MYFDEYFDETSDTFLVYIEMLCVSPSCFAYSLRKESNKDELRAMYIPSLCFIRLIVETVELNYVKLS